MTPSGRFFLQSFLARPNANLSKHMLMPMVVRDSRHGVLPLQQAAFSNLTHYVRSGDFVSWLLDNARTINELAFAIGALSHYLGDSIGHSEAINPQPR